MPKAKRISLHPSIWLGALFCFYSAAAYCDELAIQRAEYVTGEITVDGKTYQINPLGGSAVINLMLSCFNDEDGGQYSVAVNEVSPRDGARVIFNAPGVFDPYNVRLSLLMKTPSGLDAKGQVLMDLRYKSHEASDAKTPVVVTLQLHPPYNIKFKSLGSGVAFTNECKKLHQD